MQYYRCKCGEMTGFGSMPMPRCLACPKCGSDLATSPDLHREPEAHDFSARVEQMGVDGPVEVPVCRWCNEPEWRIAQQAQAAARKEAEDG